MLFLTLKDYPSYPNNKVHVYNQVCNKQINYMNWLMAKYEYSVTQFGLCLGEGGGTKNIPYIEPHPHCTSKSHCPCHIFQQMHHCHQNLTTWKRSIYVYSQLCVHTYFTCIHIHAYTCKFTIHWYCCTLYHMHTCIILVYTQAYYWFRRCARMLADLYTHNR